MTTDEKIKSLIERLLQRKMINLSDIVMVREYLEEDSVLHHETADALEAFNAKVAELRAENELLHTHNVAGFDEEQALRLGAQIALVDCVKEVEVFRSKLAEACGKLMVTEKRLTEVEAERDAFAAEAAHSFNKAIELKAYRDQLVSALRDLLKWVAPIAGDNRDEKAAALEIGTTERAQALVSGSDVVKETALEDGQ